MPPWPQETRQLAPPRVDGAPRAAAPPRGRPAPRRSSRATGSVRLCFRDAECVYLGKASDLRSRLGTHLGTSLDLSRSTLRSWVAGPRARTLARAHPPPPDGRGGETGRNSQRVGRRLRPYLDDLRLKVRRGGARIEAPRCAPAAQQRGIANELDCWVGRAGRTHSDYLEGARAGAMTKSTPRSQRHLVR